MNVVIIMQLSPLCKLAIIGALLAGATAMAGAPDKTIMESVKAMERELGLTITTPDALFRSVRQTQVPDNYFLLPPAISPDGNALAWWMVTFSDPDEKIPFLTLESLKEGRQPVRVEGRVPVGMVSISSGAEVIVAMARPLQSRRAELLAIDRRSGLVVHDLTPFLTQFELGNVRDMNVSGPGNLVALSSREPELIQVLEIPSGKTVYAGPGRFPRLSPDGKRLAFVDKDKIWVHSFADGSTVQLVKGKRVKGAGGWSPDGRFLLAGAWTKIVAFEKRQIIVDTTTGEYAVIDKLGDGDYGNHFAWVSVKLLPQISK